MPTTDTRVWSAANGQEFKRYELPPAEMLPAPVAKAAKRYSDLLAEWTAAAAAVRAIDTKPARAQAEEADTRALGEALAAEPPRPDPGEKNLRAYEEKVRAAVRRKAGSARAVKIAADELAAAVDTHRAAIDKAAGERTAKAEAAWLEFVGKLPAVALELAEARRLADWPADMERRQPWGRPMPLPEVATIAGNVTADTLAQVLRSLVAPPEPEPAAPLHITDDVIGGPRSKAAA